MSKSVRIDEHTLNKIIKESIKRTLLREYQEVEDIPFFDIFTKHMSMGERDDILSFAMYDKNDEFVGYLGDLHCKYDATKNDVVKQPKIY